MYNTGDSQKPCGIMRLIVESVDHVFESKSSILEKSWRNTATNHCALKFENVRENVLSITVLCLQE